MIKSTANWQDRILAWIVKTRINDENVPLAPKPLVFPSKKENHLYETFVGCQMYKSDPYLNYFIFFHLLTLFHSFLKKFLRLSFFLLYVTSFVRVIKNFKTWPKCLICIFYGIIYLTEKIKWMWRENFKLIFELKKCYKYF